MIGKILSVIAKIIIGRTISKQAMALYSLVLPTFTLLITISQLGISQTISKLIAKKTYNRFKIMQVAFLLSLIIDLIVGVLYIFLVPIIANSLLKNKDTMLTLYSLVFILPLISTSSLLKGYYIGIDEVEKSSICQISEELTRILFIVIVFKIYNFQNISIITFLVMFSSLVGEVASIIHLLICLRKKYKYLPYLKCDNENNKQIRNNILKLSLMSTSTRLIGSLVYFIEPILYTNILLSLNVAKEKVFIDYGIVNGYVFPLLLLPTFFSTIFANYLLPKLSKYIEECNYKMAKKLFIYFTLFAFIIGLVFTSIIFFFPDEITNALYGKNEGLIFIKRYAFPLSIVFIQPIIHCASISFNKEKELVIESLICNIIRIILFLILIRLYLIDGLILAIIISLYVSLLFQIVIIIKSFKTLKSKNKFIVNK